MAFSDAQNLNFERSINPSPGLFFYLDENGKKRPLPLQEQSIVGAFGSYTENEKTLERNLEAPNPQRIDLALLPFEYDTINIQFSVSYADNSLAPRMCNDIDFRESISRFTSAYYQKDNFQTLADRYHRRILDAGWFWRNRKLATEKRVWVQDEDGNVIADIEPDNDQLPESPDLKERIRVALAGETDPFRIVVTGQGVMGYGQQVHPSQEFVDQSRQGSGAGKKSRHLAHVNTYDPISKENVQQAIFHPQKIGNYLRRVDDWYSKDAEYGPIPAEPYGMMLNRFQAARRPKNGNDLYSYFKAIDSLCSAVENADKHSDIPGDAHFVMACLMRGGVFSAARAK